VNRFSASSSVDGIGVTVVGKGEDDGGTISIWSLLPVGLNVAVGEGEYDGSLENPIFVSTDGIGVVLGAVVKSMLSVFVVVGCNVSVGVVDNDGSAVLMSGLYAEGLSVGHCVSVGDVDIDGLYDLVGKGEADDGDDACGTGPLPWELVNG
jgi:hypothetical protein